MKRRLQEEANIGTYLPSALSHASQGEEEYTSGNTQHPISPCAAAQRPIYHHVAAALLAAATVDPPPMDAGFVGARWVLPLVEAAFSEKLAEAAWRCWKRMVLAVFLGR